MRDPPCWSLVPCQGLRGRGRDATSMAGAEFAAVVSNVAVGMLATFMVAKTLNASIVSPGSDGDAR
jgi:hypothetical protein